ncbi:MAG: hypothetical protein K0V04_14570 [Deltaproteobacteria bacterium]|nr:hypothetical protein [Deltaproteobacteria bacterium]
MARIPVAEYRAQAGSTGLVPVGSSTPAKPRSDLARMADAAPASSATMIVAGVGMATFGLLGMLVLGRSLMLLVLMGSMLSAGAGIALLGALKRQNRKAQEPAVALPPASPATVVAQRITRVRAALDEGGARTFEGLLALLRWTEPALLETLVAMKETNQVVEDLDLDTGEWFYRTQVTEYGSALPGGAMTLADRQALKHQPET